MRLPNAKVPQCGHAGQGPFTGQVFIGGAIALIPGNLIQLLVEAQVLNGIITPIRLT